MGVTSAVAAVAGLALAGYSADESRQAAKDTHSEQLLAQAKAAQKEYDARKQIAEQKPMEKSAKLEIVKPTEKSTLGSLGLMIEPAKRTPTLGGTTSTGLGFGV